MFSKVILLSLLPLCLFTNCEKIAPAKSCLPISETDCQQFHEQKLLDFKKQEGYQLTDPVYCEFEDNLTLGASCRQNSVSVYDEFPRAEGGSTCITCVRPKPKAAKAEVKEGAIPPNYGTCSPPFLASAINAGDWF